MLKIIFFIIAIVSAYLFFSSNDYICVINGDVMYSKNIKTGELRGWEAGCTAKEANDFDRYIDNKYSQ